MLLRGHPVRLVLILAVMARVVHGQGKKFVCGFSITRANKAGYLPEYIPLEICTHVNVKSLAFPSFIGRQMLFKDSDKIAFSRVITSVRQRSNTVRVIATIEGTPRDFTDASGTIARRKAFVQAVATVLLELDADAIELDWKNPGSSNAGAGNQLDRITMVNLLQDLHQAVSGVSNHIKGRPRELWFQGSLHFNVIEEAYNIFDICDQVDHVALDPDPLGRGSGSVHAPLYVKPHVIQGLEQWGIPQMVIDIPNSIDRATQLWIDGGCPPRKLLLGISLYGLKRTRSTAFPFNRRYGEDDFFPSFGDGDFIQHREICTKLRERGWTFSWDRYGLMPYATRALQNSQEERVSYEDLNSLRYKMDMVEQKRFGGVYIEFVHTDDVYGYCGQPYALTAYLAHRVRSIPSDIGFAIEWN